MKYKVELEQVSLEKAVELMESLPPLTVFYTYEIGRPIHKLDRDSLPNTILEKAIYLTPSSFVEVD